jgi:hypothetical protein
MKLIISLLVVAALAACGGKSTKSATPDNTTGTTTETQTTTQGTGGATYGGATYGTPGTQAAAPAEGTPR